MRTDDAIQRAIGLVTAVQMHAEGDTPEEWQNTIDVLTDDLSPTDKVDVMLELAGMVGGCVAAMVGHIDSMQHMSIEDYLRRLALFAEEEWEDPNQGKLF